MNKIILTGRTTKDAEVRYNGENAIASFTMAVDRKFKQEGRPDADFIRCVSFGKQAEFAEKYLHKGIKILVTGRLQTGSYDDKDGKKIYTTDVIVEEIEFCESKKASQESTPSQDASGFMPIPADIAEELPFA